MAGDRRGRKRVVLDQKISVDGLEHEAAFSSHLDHDLLDGEHALRFASNIGGSRLIVSIRAHVTSGPGMYRWASHGGTVGDSGDSWRCVAETPTASCATIERHAVLESRDAAISGGATVEYEWRADAPLSRTYSGSKFVPFV